MDLRAQCRPSSRLEAEPEHTGTSLTSLPVSVSAGDEESSKKLRGLENTSIHIEKKTKPVAFKCRQSKEFGR